MGRRAEVSWGAMSNKSRPEKGCDAFATVLVERGHVAMVKISKRGVPLVVVRSKDGTSFSACYFGKARKFRLFTPYPSGDAEQVRTPLLPFDDALNLAGLWIHGVAIGTLSEWMDALGCPMRSRCRPKISRCRTRNAGCPSAAGNP